jgi:tRNA-dihydrouridine synthase
MIEMTSAIVRAVKLPVTVKTRLGWDENSRIIWMWQNGFRIQVSPG